MAEQEKELNELCLRVGNLKDINGIVAFERRLLKYAARGKIGLAEAERLSRIAKELRLSLGQRDLEKSVNEAKALLEDVKRSKARGNL